MIRRSLVVLGLTGLTLALAAGPASAAKAKGVTGAKGTKALLAAASKTVQMKRLTTAGPMSCPYCDMAGADLKGRDLTNANLTGARLTNANFEGANLDGAQLIGADLTKANFNNAKLNPSSLGTANLSRSILLGATFQGAQMNGTNLQYAKLGGAVFSRTDLTRAVFGPRIQAGVHEGRKTSFRDARLRHEFATDPAVMELEGARWQGTTVTAAANEEIVCGRADLSGLTSRIYVASKGADDASCGATYDKPCATIGYGIGRCAASGCGILVAWDEYKPAATIALRDGVNVYGGCLPKSQSKPEYFSAVRAPGGGQPAMSSTSVNGGVVLQSFQLTASEAGGNNAAVSVALTVKDSSKLSVLDTELVANKGGQGAAGNTPGDGTRGGNGSGRDGGKTSACGNTTGGTGSVRQDVTVDNGVFTFTCKPSCSANGCWGYNGSSGTTGFSASGGQWGNSNCTECPSSRGEIGKRGGDGRHAGCGGKGVPSGNVSGGFSGDNWVASTGGNASAGGNGGGSGGGGAGGYKAGSCFWVKTEYAGNTGGGGGAGGCLGTGGAGGQQGGASFALLAMRSTVTLVRTAVVGGTGGVGGNGGNGARAGQGGDGAGGATNEGGGFGGSGGTGGAGGAGGGAAGGNGGPAVGAALVGSTLQPTTVVYYPGQSGNPGENGKGGSPIVTGACQAPNGDNGVKGLVADTHSY
jgi:uncharacterized protein YjbI with pentapeptide repeats